MQKLLLQQNVSLDCIKNVHNWSCGSAHRRLFPLATVTLRWPCVDCLRCWLLNHWWHIQRIRAFASGSWYYHSIMSIYFSTYNFTKTRHVLFGLNQLSESFAVLFLCFFSFLLSGSLFILPGVVCGRCLWCRQQREVQSVRKGHTFWRNTGMSNPWNSWEMGVSHGGKRAGVWLLLRGNLLLYSEGFLLVLS